MLRTRHSTTREPVDCKETSLVMPCKLPKGRNQDQMRSNRVINSNKIAPFRLRPQPHGLQDPGFSKKTEALSAVYGFLLNAYWTPPRQCRLLACTYKLTEPLSGFVSSVPVSHFQVFVTAAACLSMPVPCSSPFMLLQQNPTDWEA